MSFQRANSDLFFAKTNAPGASSDPRLGELTLRQELKTAKWVIAGYPDDEGVRLNGGRPGANEGPDVIRRHLYRMTPSPFAQGENSVSVYDVGNLNIDRTLAERHEEAKSAGLIQLMADRRMISLGGGHDYAYSDVSTFLAWCKAQNQRGIVLNFDAHLDVREHSNGLNSGTAFRRVTEEHDNFDFYQIGIQAQCNSRAHVEWARSKKIELVTWDEIELAGAKGQAEFILSRLESLLVRKRPVFLSVDLDAFALPLSLGTSAPSAIGFTSDTFLPIWETLRSRLDVRAAGFYEHAPIYDPQHCTARLAALLVHRLVACGPTA